MLAGGSAFLLLLQVKPLIWIESVIEKHSHSRIEYMVKVSGRVVSLEA